MKIEKLYYFESAARQKSFTKAASECLVAQPAISHSIKSLESELGFDVFVRDKKNVSLTPQGEVFYNDVVKILDNIELVEPFPLVPVMCIVLYLVCGLSK